MTKPEMPTAYFKYQNTLLAYQEIGTGKKIMLFFHGYGQSKKVFEVKATELGQEYTCYLFDLFFHGESEWSYGEEVLTKQFWSKSIELFLVEQKIDRFSVAGFSLGARFVFATLESVPDKIDDFFLIAPDGIKNSLWYNLATYPIALRKLFKSMIFHEGRFYSIAHFINRLGLVDNGLLRFAESQMKTEEMRKRVYYSWVVFRKLKFNIPAIAALIRKHAIRTTLIIGRFDKVITETNMKKLLKHLPECTVIKLETGHNGLIEKWKPFL